MCYLYLIFFYFLSVLLLFGMVNSSIHFTKLYIATVIYIYIYECVYILSPNCGKGNACNFISVYKIITLGWVFAVDQKIPESNTKTALHFIHVMLEANACTFKQTTTSIFQSTK
jgi:hypothetical protein